MPEASARQDPSTFSETLPRNIPSHAPKAVGKAVIKTYVRILDTLTGIALEEPKLPSLQEYHE